MELNEWFRILTSTPHFVIKADDLDKDFLDWLFEVDEPKPEAPQRATCEFEQKASTN